jgi:uncharacterized protein (TIGR03382 family)
MKSWLPICCFLFLPITIAHAETYEPIWDFSAELEGSVVKLDLTTRYVSCGMAARIDRVGPDSRETIWEATGGIGLDTVDAQIGCQCEPVGSSHGTGRKSCPNQACTKDEQCACSKLCAQILDDCPPAGTSSYELMDLDGNLVQTVALAIPETLSGCATMVVESEPEAPPTESGGCSATGKAGTGTLWLLLLLAAALVRPPRGRAALLVSLAAILALGCGDDKKVDAESNAPSKIALEPVDSNLEGTPWEEVLRAQTELLEHFEVAGDPVATMRLLKRWRQDNLETFKVNCKAALEHYAKDSMHRMDHLVKAGRAWSVVDSRVRKISKEWGPAEQHDVGILLGEFECR